MTRHANRIVSNTSWLHRILTGGPRAVSFTADALHIEGPPGSPAESISVDDIDRLTLRRSWFRRRLTVLATGRMERAVGGLDYRIIQVNEAILDTTARLAEDLESRIGELDSQLQDLLNGESYVRRSVATEIHDALTCLVRKCGGLVREHLEPEANAALDRLARFEPEARFESARSRANDRFISSSIPAVRRATDQTLPISVTGEQARAIATNEDVTLVLAGAGTGKTATIVGKVVHLVRNEQVEPRQILVLAYNKKAAQEIHERLPGDDLSRVEVLTFHKFGRQVISHEIAPSVSELATDPQALRRAIRDILDLMLTDPDQQDSVTDFLAYHHKPYRSAFDFRTPAEYDDYVRTIELRTLNGEQVRSFEELVISNFLTEHEIQFKYEQPYRVPTATRDRQQYRPDFFLPEYDIYIEHFALDEYGSAPPTWTGYTEGVQWKKDIHNRHGTRLITTYSWQYRRGVLLAELRARLEAEGVTFTRVPRQRLISLLGERLLSWLTQVIMEFLNHVKTSGITSDELRRRARSMDDRLRNESFLTIFEHVKTQYEHRLEHARRIDFHDMINDATRHLRDGRRGHPYRYILVDEFQDISRGRMMLLHALREWYPDTAYFLVGDDWQSIYRFAGSDVRLVREVQDHSSDLGHASTRTLSLTFRFGDGILDPSSAFIQRNPEQTQRPLRSARDADDGGITIVGIDPTGTNPRLRRFRFRGESVNFQGLNRALEDIEQGARGNRERPSVLVLGRYRNSANALHESRRNMSSCVEFSTVHRAKGREADYVIVLDLILGSFPSDIEDDPLLELVLPPVSATAYPFAEERRLFYVAITRGRKGVYVVTDSSRPSPFVRELLQESPGLRNIGESIRPCPSCANGTLRIIDGSRGLFWGCSQYSARPRCTYTDNI